MSETKTKQVCCICLEKHNKATLVLNHSLLEILRAIVPEIEWRLSWLICTTCCEEIETIAAFRQLCIASNSKLLKNHFESSNHTKHANFDSDDTIASNFDIGSHIDSIQYDCTTQNENFETADNSFVLSGTKSNSFVPLHYSLNCVNSKIDDLNCKDSKRVKILDIRVSQCSNSDFIGKNKRHALTSNSDDFDCINNDINSKTHNFQPINEQSNSVLSEQINTFRSNHFHSENVNSTSALIVESKTNALTSKINNVHFENVVSGSGLIVAPTTTVLTFKSNNFDSENVNSDSGLVVEPKSNVETFSSNNFDYKNVNRNSGLVLEPKSNLETFNSNNFESKNVNSNSCLIIDPTTNVLTFKSNNFDSDNVNSDSGLVVEPKSNVETFSSNNFDYKNVNRNSGLILEPKSNVETFNSNHFESKNVHSDSESKIDSSTLKSDDFDSKHSNFETTHRDIPSDANAPPKIGSKTRKFTCEHCQKCVKSASGLKVHIKRMHTINDESMEVGTTHETEEVEIRGKENVINEEVNKAEMKLPGLDVKEMDDKNELEDTDEEQDEKGKKKHMLYRKMHLNLECELCQRKLQSVKDLLVHASEKHGLNAKEVKPFTCNVCPKRFCTSSNLLQHNLYHTASRTHMCTYCGKGFITPNDLNIHEKQHLNMREYICEICSKGYNTHKDIRTHKLVVHADPASWKHVCKFCDKPFPMKSSLDAHVRRHTGEKRFACHLCDKKFTDKVVLQKHVKSHSNIRPFKCEKCPKEYKDKKIYEIHLARIHGLGDAKIPTKVREKKYFCHICPKSYFDKTKLTKHLCVHSGEKPFACRVCLKGFTDRNYVVTHMLNVHKIAGDS